MKEGLIPQKRVVAILRVSRSSLWRARESAIPGFPAPVLHLNRTYWREEDLPSLRDALDRFQGRTVFEEQRRHAKACAVRAEASALRMKRRRIVKPLGQSDLFGD